MQLMNVDQQFTLRILHWQIGKLFNDFSRNPKNVEPKEISELMDIWVKSSKDVYFQFKNNGKTLGFVSLENSDQEVATLRIFSREKEDIKCCMSRLKGVLDYGFIVLNLKRINFSVSVEALELKEILNQGIYGFTKWKSTEIDYVYDLSKVEFLNLV